MNILYIAHRIPYPPNKGDKIRSFHEIEYLSRRHTIHLATLMDDPEDLRYVEALKKYCSSVHVVRIDKRRAKLRSLLAIGGRSSLSVAYFSSPELMRVIDWLLAEYQFDLIFIFSSSMVQYVGRNTSIPQVIDLVDVDSDKWFQYAERMKGPQAWIYRMEGKRLQNVEREIAMRAEQCILVSQKDAEILTTMLMDDTVGLKISVISNGVDLAYFHPDSRDFDPKLIVFVGAMDYFPNVDGVLFFCRKVLPIIREEIPDVEFKIVGSNPDKKVRQLDNGKHIHVTGKVDDIRPYLKSAGVSVAPLRIARGIQNKILESMAMGIPVVSTSKAFEGIDAEPGKDLLLADDPPLFARHVVDVLRNGQLRRSLSVQGRKRIEQLYSWDIRMNDLEKLLLTVREKACEA